MGRKISKSQSLFLLVLTAVLWSSSGILVKSVNWSPVALSSARGLIAGLTLCLILPGGFRPLVLTRTHWLSGMSTALLSMCFVGAMKLTTAANVIVLQYTAPLWVALLAPFFLMERTLLRDWLCMFAIFGGMVLFFMDSLSTDGFYGNILAIISGFFFATQAMFLRSIKDNSPGSALILGNFLTFLFGLPAWGAPWPDFISVLLILALGVFQFGLPYYLYTLAIPQVSSLELVLVTMLEPILSPLWVFLFLREAPGRFAFMGGLVVLLSVLAWSLAKARKI